MFPCSHFFNKTSPTHIHNLLHNFFFGGKGYLMLLIRHIYQLTLYGLSGFKKQPNSYWLGRLVSEISAREVTNLLCKLEQGLKIWLIMIKTTLRVHAIFIKPINLLLRQFWWSIDQGWPTRSSLAYGL